MNSSEREKKAMALFREGYNCCQSVVLAFADEAAALAGLDENQLKALASGFGGGFGRMREVCGCVSGMTIMSGILHPADPSDQQSRRDNYALVQSLAGEFRKENGSIVCRDLLALRTSGGESPQPSERTEHYYAVRPCERLVGCAARILNDCLNSNKTNN